MLIVLIVPLFEIPPTINHQKPKLNQTKIKLKRKIKIKTSNNIGKLLSQKKKKIWTRLVFKKTKSIKKLVLSSLMWIKEDEFLFVTRKRLHKGLETVAIHFEDPSAVGVE